MTGSSDVVEFASILPIADDWETRVSNIAITVNSIKREVRACKEKIYLYNYCDINNHSSVKQNLDMIRH